MGTKGELFRIWYALNDKHMDPSVFVLSHLVETTKINYNNVIGVGGIITAIAKGIGFGGKFGILEAHFTGRILELATLVHMKINLIKGDAHCYPYHRKTLFNFLNVRGTTLADRGNLSYDGRERGE